MRFNREDLRRGNISQERMREVVLQTVLKVDERYEKQNDILRMSSSLLATLDKEIKFKKSEIYDKEILIDKENYKKNVNDLIFFTKVKKANIEIMNFEAVLIHTKMEEIKKAVLAKIDYFNKLKEEKRISEHQYHQNLLELKAIELQMLINEKNMHLQQMAELSNYIKNLERAIEEYEKNIRAARKYHSQEVIKHLNDVGIGQQKTFEGMTQEQKEKFIHGYFAIKEVVTRRKVEIDREIVQEENRLLQQNGRKPDGVMFSFEKNKSTSSFKIEQLKKERAHLKKAEFAKIRELGDATGNRYINTKVSEEKCKQHIHAFEKHEKIEKHVKGFINDVKKGQNNILDLKEEIASKKEILRFEEQNVQKTEKSIESELNGIDEIKKQSQEIVSANQNIENKVNINVEQVERENEERIEIIHSTKNIENTYIEEYQEDNEFESLEDFSDLEFDSDLLMDDEFSEVNFEDCHLVEIDSTDPDLRYAKLDNFEDEILIDRTYENKGPEKTSGRRI